MATIQRPMPKGDTPWDYLRHVADAACQRGGAYLTGQYAFTFTNSADRTVKLHLSDDRAVRARGAAGAQDYFLTVPSHKGGVEVPMTTERIRVTAGFFHRERGTYEVFWEGRPFSWEPGCVIEVAPRHSVDVNRFRIDVWPGAPEAFDLASLPGTTPAVSRAPASLRLFVPQGPWPLGAAAGRPQPGACEGPSLPGLRIFSQGGGGWVAGSAARELADGSLEVREGAQRWLVQPQEEAVLALLPAADSIPLGGSAASCADASERPQGQSASTDSAGSPQRLTTAAAAGSDAEAATSPTETGAYASVVRSEASLRTWPCTTPCAGELVRRGTRTRHTE